MKETMSTETNPILPAQPENSPQPAPTRTGLGVALLFIFLTTVPVLAVMYLGASLLHLSFPPFDLYDWPTRAGLSAWAEAMDAIAAAQVAAGGNMAQSSPLVRWVVGLLLLLLFAFVIGLGLYALTVRRGRAPDTIDGLVAGALLAAPMLFISLTAGNSSLPSPLNAVWLAALYMAWGVILAFAYRRYSSLPAERMAPEPAAADGIDRRQFLVRFGAGAAAITAIGAAGTALAPGKKAAQLQRTLPMISPEFREAEHALFGNFRRFALVRGGGETAEGSNVLALGAEYPDRQYVSIWLGGRSPIVIYENLETAIAAFGTEEEAIGVYWLDN